MKITEALQILKDHQKWRRGDDSIEATNPKQLGIAIDVILDAVEKILEVSK